ncbi:MAG: HIT family protein [Candidatus Magasanikbacteria bacterium]|nr:HIT family protein [Candidatus Magasanikbacteria bacterium]
MQDCLFCKIVAGEIPSYKVWDDEYAFAFLDIHPCSKGHAVIVPKKHFADLWEMSIEDAALMGASLRAAAGRVQAKLNPDGMNIGLNNGKAAGQAVAHAHWHIIPRWNGDGGGSMHSIIRSGGDVEVKEVAKLFI